MIISGFQKFSLIDYSGKICAVIFTQGCNFRCPYCHNPELVNSEFFPEPVPEEEIFSFLKKRKGKLDGLVVTGGEPTLQKDMIEFLKKVKEMGYSTKLDSNGSNPDVLEELIDSGLVDYFAMDVKAPLEKYREVTNSDVDSDKIGDSIDLIKNSGLNYEFRTTVVRPQLSSKDIIGIGKLIKGAKLYILQKFVPSKTLNPEFIDKEPYSDEEFGYLINTLENLCVKCLVR